MTAPRGPLLLLDTGSPRVSVAVARMVQDRVAPDIEVVAARSIEQQRSSAHLLDLIGEALAEAGITVRDLGGIAVLRGPGSFTGLRIGLATVLGLHQALGVPATALPSLQVMAAAVGAREGEVVIAAVDALRGDWSAQAFSAGTVPRPLGSMELLPGPSSHSWRRDDRRSSWASGWHGWRSCRVGLRACGSWSRGRSRRTPPG